MITNIKARTKCSICGTEWYENIFHPIDCPGCHGDPEKTECVFSCVDSQPAVYLCATCPTTWKQDNGKKPECPSCKHKHPLPAKVCKNCEWWNADEETLPFGDCNNKIFEECPLAERAKSTTLFIYSDYEDYAAYFRTSPDFYCVGYEERTLG